MKISRRSFIKATLCFSGALSFPGRLTAASQKAGQRWTPGYAKLEDRGRLAPGSNRPGQFSRNAGCAPESAG